MTRIRAYTQVLNIMRKQKLSFLSLSAFLTIMLSCSVAVAAKRQGTYKSTDENSFSVLVDGKVVVCSRQRPNRKFVPVRELRRKRVQPLGKYIRELRSQIADEDKGTKKFKRLRKRIKNFQKLNRGAKAICAQGPSNPIAADATVRANAIDRVAVSLSVDANQPNTTATCEIVGTSSEIKIEMQQDCNLLVEPKSHTSSPEYIEFVAIRSSDGARSRTAKLQIIWDQSGDFIGDAQSLAPYKDRLSRAEAFHLLRWVGMGAKASELIERAQQPGGLDAVVAALTTPDNRPECLGVERAALDASYPYRHRRNQGHLGTSFTAPSGLTEPYPYGTSAERTWSGTAAAHYWLYHMANTCEPLRERMAMLWHNHFALPLNMGGVDAANSTRNDWIINHLNVLRGNIPEAQGSLFTRLDHIVAFMHGADGLMVRWLNNNENVFGASGGNENYAREILELFTAGPTDIVRGNINYSEQDIYNLRFALMGYTDLLSSNTETVGTFYGCCDPTCSNGSCQTCAAMPPAERCRDDVPLRKTRSKFFNNRWNAVTQPIGTYLFQGQTFEKFDVFKANVLGVDGDASSPIYGDTSQDNLTPYLMYSHPGVRRFLASRIIATFSSLELTDALVVPVAETLVSNNYDPTAALRLILKSSAFYAAANRNDSIANPVERVISHMRLLGLPVGRFTNGSGTNDLIEEIRNLIWSSDYPLTRMPTVFGVQETGKIVGNDIMKGLTFLSTQSQLESMKQLTNYVNDLHNAAANGRVSFEWSDLLPSARPTAEEALEHFVVKLGLELTDEQRELLLEYLTTVTTDIDVVEGLEVPRPSSTYTVPWDLLNDAQFTSLWNHKGPGMVIMLYSLPQVSTR